VIPLGLGERQQVPGSFNVLKSEKLLKLETSLEPRITLGAALSLAAAAIIVVEPDFVVAKFSRKPSHERGMGRHKDRLIVSSFGLKRET